LLTLLNLSLHSGGGFVIHQNHLLYMMYNSLSPADRNQFRLLTSLNACVDFLKVRNLWSDDSDFRSPHTDSVIRKFNLNPASSPDLFAAYSSTSSATVQSQADSGVYDSSSSSAFQLSWLPDILPCSRKWGPSPTASSSIIDPLSDLLDFASSDANCSADFW
jgi:hypothetical protein